MDTGTHMCVCLCTSFEYSAQTKQNPPIFTHTAATAVEKILKHPEHPVVLSVYMENAVHSSDIPMSYHSRAEWVKTFVLKLFTCAHVDVFVRESTLSQSMSHSKSARIPSNEESAKFYFIGSHARLFTAECCWYCVTCTALSTYGLVWQLLLKSKHPP